MLTSTSEVTIFSQFFGWKEFTNYISPLQATQVFLIFSPVIEFQHLRRVFGGVNVVIEAEVDDSLLNLLEVPTCSYYALSPAQRRYNFSILHRFSGFLNFMYIDFNLVKPGVSVGLVKNNLNNGIPDWIIYLLEQFSRRLLQVLINMKAMVSNILTCNRFWCEGLRFLCIDVCIWYLYIHLSVHIKNRKK